MAKITYADALESSMAAQMEKEHVYDRRLLSETGRSAAIAKARSMEGKKLKKHPVENTLDESTLGQLAAALESRPDLRLILEAATGTRPDATELKEMDENTFESHYASTIMASAGQRLAPPGSRQGPVRESTPATRPDATELKEMDSVTFADHYGAAIMAAKQGR